MLETISDGQGGTQINARVNRVGIYLDNFAIISIATRDADRRRRFISIFQNGADLMFSPTSAAEILGPQNRATILAIRDFLDEIGPNWFPLETVELLEVMKREDEGISVGGVCLSEWFLKQYFAAGNIWRHGEQRIGPVEPDFFRLSLVLDWLPAQRERMRELGAGFEASVLRTQIMRMRKLYERDRRGFRRVFPRPSWQDNKPATFVYHSLLWQLVMEARAFQIKRGDGHDFFHSVMASAYSHFAALDKHWKRRIEMLPKPNRLAAVYYEPQLNDLADAVEAIL